MTKTLIQNKGVKFFQKVRWRMQHDRNPLFITLQDKYKVRQYAESKQVSTPKLLYVTKKPESIPFDSLPDSYFIKANHGWQWNILCFNSRYYLFGNGEDLVNSDGTFINLETAPKYEISKLGVIQQCNTWLKSRHNPKEWAYQHISPVIIVESLILPKDSSHLRDYRMYTFHGKVKAISIGSAIYRKTKVNIFFDTKWKPIPLSKYKEKLPDILPEKPNSLDEMISAAERLGEDIDFARIDLYDTKKEVLLGEVTIYPEAGNIDSPTTCPLFNTWLGNQWIG